MSLYSAWVNTLCFGRRLAPFNFLQWQICHLDSLEAIALIVGDDSIHPGKNVYLIFLRNQENWVYRAHKHFNPFLFYPLLNTYV